LEYIKEQGRHCIIEIPEDKKVESINFSDGECVLFLDLPDDLVERLCDLANKNDTSIDEVVSSILKSYIKERPRVDILEGGPADAYETF